MESVQSENPQPEVDYEPFPFGSINNVHWKLQVNDERVELGPIRGAALGVGVMGFIFGIGFLVLAYYQNFTPEFAGMGVLGLISAVLVMYFLFKMKESRGPMLVFERASRTVRLPRAGAVLEGTEAWRCTNSSSRRSCPTGGKPLRGFI